MSLPAQKPDTRLFEVDRSATGRFWTLSPVDEALVRRLAPSVGGSDLLARLLAGRGVEPSSAASYLAPTLRDTFPDPSAFADMDKAAAIVFDAILAKKKITVFADYDVDGGTSSAILTRYFRAWGEPLGLYVPDRLEEGYGPSPEAFRHLKDTGNDLVITVDCGAAAVHALEEAERIGLDVVVIDHHLMAGHHPPAAALVNPNRPDDTSGQGHLAAAVRAGPHRHPGQRIRVAHQRAGQPGIEAVDVDLEDVEPSIERHPRWVDVQLAKGGHGGRTVSHMNRAERALAAAGRLHRHVGGLRVADFADKHNIGIHSQYRGQRNFHCHVVTFIDVDLAHEWNEQFDRVLNRNNVLVLIDE